MGRHIITRAMEDATKSVSVTAATVVDFDDFGFSAQQKSDMNAMVISAVTNTIMVTWSGVDPTATLGHALAVNQILVLNGPHIANIKMIGQSGTATATITLER